MVKELENEFKEIKDKLGINAFDRLSNYFYTLQRKIEYLIKSRDNWKNKYIKLKKESDKK
jgi:hypothetical protein